MRKTSCFKTIDIVKYDVIVENAKLLVFVRTLHIIKNVADGNFWFECSFLYLFWMKRWNVKIRNYFVQHCYSVLIPTATGASVLSTDSILSPWYNLNNVPVKGYRFIQCRPIAADIFLLIILETDQAARNFECDSTFSLLLGSYNVDVHKNKTQKSDDVLARWIFEQFWWCKKENCCQFQHGPSSYHAHREWQGKLLGADSLQNLMWIVLFISVMKKLTRGFVLYFQIESASSIKRFISLFFIEKRIGGSCHNIRSRN